ncbi:8-amino-7-oxononanoate synthase [Zea mays]|uniref:8-amino-7-oxononanoate synthase n=1 Tax=Zea mays TaxID=4577 RepID=A0A3L6G853_MAIZE|nr:8-amino-7-oxononanoate synthase [Zea mays]
MGQWDALVDAALARLEARSLLRATRPIALAAPTAAPRTFDGPGPWDHAAVEIRLDRDTLHQWLAEGDEAGGQEEQLDGNLILFSGNDYMGLSSHPAVREAAVKDCLLCPTGFSANMAAITALGSITSLLSPGRKPAEHERIAIFSDALNHASIIDGIRLLERQQEALVFVYKHCDMFHLDFLLLFSMDGDFAPFPELIKLRRKYGYLLVIDDAHGTLVCGENGGGAAELFECEKDIDIGVGTLSKAAGCQGGFITCSTQWKRLIQSRGRSFIFSTALPVPVVASVHGNIHYLTHVPVLQIDVPFNNMLS